MDRGELENGLSHIRDRMTRFDLCRHWETMTSQE